MNRWKNIYLIWKESGCFFDVNSVIFQRIFPQMIDTNFEVFQATFSINSYLLGQFAKVNVSKIIKGESF